MIRTKALKRNKIYMSDIIFILNIYFFIDIRPNDKLFEYTIISF